MGARALGLAPPRLGEGAGESKEMEEEVDRRSKKGGRHADHQALEGQEEGR